MTRKQLPKAIRPVSAEVHVIGSGHQEEAAIAQAAVPKRQIEAHPGDFAPSPPPANDPLPVAAPLSQLQAQQRLREAFRIVERHKMYAGLGGLVPLPAVNVTGVTAANLTMVKKLSDLYGVSFERDKMRSIVIGLMGGAAPAGLAAATSSTLAFVVPFAGAFGLAVSTVAAAALTRRIGLHFVERFERGSAV